MKKPSLTEVQYWVRSHVQTGAAKPPDFITVELDPQRGVPGRERLSVYAEGYEIRFRDGVAEVYEALRWVLGEVQFIALVRDYSEKFPSRDTNLSFVGRYLPEYLASVPLTKELPFILDLAKLEWLACEAFHAYDAFPVSAGEIAKMAPELLTQSQLIFQPSVSVIRSDWPILDIWNSRKMSRNEADIQLEGKPQSVMVCRHGTKVECRLLLDWQFQIFQGLREGSSLEAVCEKCADLFNDDLSPIMTWFMGLIQDGLILRINPPSLTR